jgi:hypothetical protein
MKIKEEDLIILDKFIDKLQFEYDSLENFHQYMKFTEEDKKIVNLGFKIIKKKLKKLQKVSSAKEFNKYAKAKKIIKNKNGLNLR